MTARDPALDLHAMLTVIGHAEESERPARGDDEIADAVAHWSEAFEPLAAAAAPARAPDHLWARIEATVREDMRTAAVVDAAETKPSLVARLWASADLWRFTTAAAVTAALLLAVFGRVAVEAPLQPAFVAVLQSPEGDRRPGFLVEVAADRRVRLVPLVTTEVAAGKALEFWTIADKAKGPQSLGLVPAGVATTLPPEALPAVTDGQLFEITLEPAAGSPIGKPTGPILYKGLTTARL